MVFPGLLLSNITLDTYKVVDLPAEAAKVISSCHTNFVPFFFFFHIGLVFYAEKRVSTFKISLLVSSPAFSKCK